MSRRLTSAESSDPIAPATTRRMARTAQRDNPAERAIRSELHRRGLRFRIHRKVLEGTRRTADIVFPRRRVAVFIDGCFWHGCPEHRTWPKNNSEWWRSKIEANIARDRDTDQRLANAGWTVIRIWGHETLNEGADRIEALLRR
ncbi:MAG TPA: very short patch repair endonuclease [Allosphingosinicella sp.]|nr:very short patch repair endonuclease [Allosphingosinicella sp.]